MLLTVLSALTVLMLISSIVVKSYASLTDDKSDVQNKINEAKNALNDISDDKDEAETELQKITTQVTEAQKQLDTLAAQIDELNDTIDEKQKEIIRKYNTRDIPCARSDNGRLCAAHNRLSDNIGHSRKNEKSSLGFPDPLGLLIDGKRTEIRNTAVYPDKRLRNRGRNTFGCSHRISDGGLPCKGCAAENENTC